MLYRQSCLPKITLNIPFPWWKPVDRPVPTGSNQTRWPDMRLSSFRGLLPPTDSVFQPSGTSHHCAAIPYPFMTSHMFKCCYLCRNGLFSFWKLPNQLFKYWGFNSIHTREVFFILSKHSLHMVWCLTYGSKKVLSEKYFDGWMNKWMNRWMRHWISEWTNEWINEWINK